MKGSPSCVHENPNPGKGDASVASKDSVRPSPSPEIATFEMTGGAVSSVITWVSFSVTGEAPPVVPSMVSV